MIGGELVMALAEGTGARSSRSTPSTRALPADPRRAARHGRATRADGLGRPVRGRTDLSGVTPRRPSRTRPGRWAGGSRSTRRP